MRLKLIPPGRRGNKVYKFYYARGTIDGRRYEVSTKTRNEAAGKRFARELEDQIIRDGRSTQDVTTFDQAAAHYLSANEPEPRQRAYVEALSAYWKGRELAGIVHADFVAAANILAPGQTNESKNRKIIGPGAAVLHYAAENRWCPYYRIKRLDQKQPTAKAADDADMDLAIARATGPLRLLLVWIRSHGGRITDTLRIRGLDMDAERGTYVFYVSKTDTWREKPMAPLLWRYYRRFKPQPGQLFPFKNRWAVYKAIDVLGVSLRPHAMRHALGKSLNARGYGLKTIMEVLDHASVNSSMRYQSADAEIVRRALVEKRWKKSVA